MNDPYPSPDLTDALFLNYCRTRKHSGQVGTVHCNGAEESTRVDNSKHFIVYSCKNIPRHLWEIVRQSTVKIGKMHNSKPVTRQKEERFKNDRQNILEYSRHLLNIGVYIF